MSNDTPTQPSEPHPTPGAVPPLSASDETLSRADANTTPHAADRRAAFPSSIGPYKILGVLGVGGMGAVYEAEQPSPKRRVALKVIKPGYVSPSLLKRFEREADVLGRLQHPGIAQVYEADTAPPEGGGPAVPYFAMELVRGTSLTRFAEEKKLDLRQRLDLVTRICDAVQYAHQQGVVHRDLKPGNILVDASGQPKILDFGIAKITGNEAQLSTMETQVGQLVGTLAYMSPEQARGEVDKLDTRSDIYALGVIAYELLAGKLPYDLKQAVILEAVRVICEDEPTPLSSVDRRYGGDIETIIAKAMAKERDRRYSSASELASDIKRFLSDEPIAARPPSTWYQLNKFARRNKPLVAGVAAVIVALTLGMVGTSIAMIRARLAEQETRKQESIATTQREQAEAERLRAETAQKNAETKLVESKLSEAEAMLASSRLPEARRTFGEAYTLCMHKGLPTLRAELGLWELERLAASPIHALTGERGIANAAVHSDGRIAVTIDTKAVRLWDLQAGVVTATWPFDMRKEFGANPVTQQVRVALSRDGTRVVIFAPQTSPAKIHTLDLRNGRFSEIVLADRDDEVLLNVSNNSRFLLTSRRSAVKANNMTREFLLRRIEDGEIANTFSQTPSHITSDIYFSEESNIWTIAARTDANKIVLHQFGSTGDVTTSEITVNSLGLMSLSADGRLIAAKPATKEPVRILDSSTGKEVVSLSETSAVQSITFLKGGRNIATTATDGVVSVWDSSTGALVRRLAVRESDSYQLASSADGATLLAIGRSGELYIHRLDSESWRRKWGMPVEPPAAGDPSHQRVGSPMPASSSAMFDFSADNRFLLSVHANRVLVWDVSTGKPVQGYSWGQVSPQGVPVPTTAVFLSSAYNIGLHGTNGVAEATLGTDPSLRIISPYFPALFVTISPRARTIFASDSRSLVSMDMDTREVRPIAWFFPRTASSQSFVPMRFNMTVSPTGSVATLIYEDGMIRIQDFASQRQTDIPEAQPGGPVGVRFFGGVCVFSHDERLFAVASPVQADGRVRIRHTSNGELVSELIGHRGPVHSISFSGDAKTVMTLSLDNTLRAWKTEDGQEIRTVGLGIVGLSKLSADGSMAINFDPKEGLSLLELRRPTQLWVLTERISHARRALTANPKDPQANEIMGAWLEMHGLYAWAKDRFHLAVTGGATKMDGLAHARTLWLTSANEDAAKMLSLIPDLPPAYTQACVRAMRTPEALFESQRRMPPGFVEGMTMPPLQTFGRPPTGRPPMANEQPRTMPSIPATQRDGPPPEIVARLEALRARRMKEIQEQAERNAVTRPAPSSQENPTKP